MPKVLTVESATKQRTEHRTHNAARRPGSTAPDGARSRRCGHARGSRAVRGCRGKLADL